MSPYLSIRDCAAASPEPQPHGRTSLLPGICSRCSEVQLYAEIIDSALKEMHLRDLLFCAWIVKWLTAISMLKGLLWTLAVHGVICVTKSWCRGAGIKLDCDMKEDRSDSIMWVAKKKQGKSDAWCLDNQFVCMETVCFQALFHEVHVGGSCLLLKFHPQYLPQCWTWWKYYLMQEDYSTEHVDNQIHINMKNLDLRIVL